MISVCLATYNGKKYIQEQLESICRQLNNDDEIIISDDGSTDETIKLIEEFHDSHIKIFHNKGIHGVVTNFENALKHTSGNIIFLSDQDDIWDEHKVEKCITALNDADLVVHNASVFFENREFQGVDCFQLRHSGPGYWKNLYKNSFMGSCMAFHKSVKDYILPFPRYILWHDMWIGLMVEKKGKTRFINDKLLYYRRHTDNASPTTEASTFSKWKMLEYRLQMLYYTSIR